MKAKLNFLVGSGLAGAVVAVLVLTPPALKDSTAAALPPQLSQGFSPIVKAVTPAVVNIQVTQGERVRGPRDPRRRDHEGPPNRKSTRLNSSHVAISYAVFCLKKKKKTK